MKKIIILILGLFILGSSVFFVYQSINLNKKKLELLPRISTESLPQAKIGQYYETEVFAFLIGAKSPIDINSTSNADLLEITDCSTTYNNQNMPKPNSVTVCKLTGYPYKSGSQEIELSASAKGFAKKSIYNFTLVVAD